MPGLDEQLKQHLERAAPPADPSGAFDRVLEKRIRRRVLRRFEAAGLAFAVVAATVGGTFVLVRAFRGGDTPARLGQVHPTPVQVGNGRIAYDQDTRGIWTINSDGSDPVNITEGSTAASYMPAWSPDGTRIAFIRETNSDPTIYVAGADGSDPVPIKRLALSNHDLAWAPNGTAIAYTDRGDLFVMRADGSHVTRITPTDRKKLDFHPTWSPDGTRIAFARFTFKHPLSSDPFVGQEPAGSGIYVVRADGSELTRLTEAPPSPEGGVIEWPDWSPNGRQIVFQRDFEIYVMNADGSSLRNVTGGHSSQPSWSPDGTRIVFQREDSGLGLNELYLMEADGSAVTSLDVDPATDLRPDWQPVIASQSPTPSPAPTPSPFPKKCDASQVTGDFDGDGQTDTATVAKSECFPAEPGSGTSNAAYSLRVQWSPSEGLVSLPDCQKACRAVAAADLNGDRIDEFVLKVDAGASNDFFEVFELPATEAFGRPATVTPPGSERWPSGEPANLSLFGSVMVFSALGCDLVQHDVIQKEVAVNDAQTKYLVHESVLRFEPVDAEPFGRFTIVSERDYTEPYDSGVSPGDQFEPGDPCWNYGA